MANDKNDSSTYDNTGTYTLTVSDSVGSSTGTQKPVRGGWTATGKDRVLFEGLDKLDATYSPIARTEYYNRDALKGVLKTIRDANYYRDLSEINTDFSDSFWKSLYRVWTGGQEIQDSELKDLGKVHNLVAGAKRIGIYSLSDISLDDALKTYSNANGFDTRIQRSIERIYKEEQRFTEISETLKSGITPQSITKALLDAYDDRLSGSNPIHYMFCVNDKNGKDFRGNWNWMYDDLGEASPLYRYYQGLNGNDKIDFINSISVLQTISNDQKLGPINKSSVTINSMANYSGNLLPSASGEVSPDLKGFLDNIVAKGEQNYAKNRAFIEPQLNQIDPFARIGKSGLYFVETETKPKSNATSSNLNPASQTTTENTGVVSNFQKKEPDWPKDPAVEAYQKKAKEYLNAHPELIESIPELKGDISNFKIDGRHGVITQAVKNAMEGNENGRNSMGAVNRTNKDFKRMSLDGTLKQELNIDYDKAIADIDLKMVGGVLASTAGTSTDVSGPPFASNPVRANIDKVTERITAG